MFSIKINVTSSLLASLLLNVVSFNIFAQETKGGILSLSLEVPSEKVINVSYPAISDWYQFCTDAEDVKSKTDWGRCTGYLYAAVQQIYQNTKKQCPNFSVKEIMDLVNAEAMGYEKRYSSPATGRNGKVIEGARIYQPGKPTAWQRPAFPILISVLTGKCTL